MNHYRAIERARCQFNFAVFADDNGVYGDEIRHLGGRVFHIGRPAVNRVTRFVRGLVRLIENEGPYDAVHCHANNDNAWVMVAASIAGVPTRASHSHDTHGMGGNALQRAYHGLQAYLIRKYATDYLACSKVAGDYLYGESFFACKGRVLHNGISLDTFIDVSKAEVSALRGSLDIPIVCPLVVGNITRFEAKKNSLFTLDVFAELLKLVPGPVLMMGGPDGGLLNQAREHVRELGIEASVRFIGPCNDAPACLALIDIYIYLFPSLYEGLPVALLEAQAAGCRRVVSSEVTREADMGLGLITYTDLNRSAREWAELANSAKDIEVPSRFEIRRSFGAKGFDVRQSSNELMEMYACNVK